MKPRGPQLALSRVRAVEERALGVLRRHGWSPGEVLGVGMEGTVVDLSDGNIAKIWHSRSRDDLTALLQFGKALGSAAVPFATSGATDLLDSGEVLITIERKVDGEPLRATHAHLGDAPVITDDEVRLMGDALEGLSHASDPRLAALPILPGELPLAMNDPFGSSLAGLARRRFHARPELLRQTVEDVDELLSLMTSKLEALPQPPRRTLVHGDLIPGNVLTKDNAVSGILDFGFLTTLGDPRFDAAITASIFDMYGPNARISEAALSEQFAARFGHEVSTYALYRAAYAIITFAAYGQDGSDGHFAWCAALLQRPDVRDALAA